ncbi:MAG: arginine--tRNA ligase [candidate division Zixibacteria bacterium]|nr:arginine--tRNA ligase [candidate division Zixibacteria bacterium]
MEVMTKDKYRVSFAEATSVAFRRLYPDQFQEVGDSGLFSKTQIYEELEKPKDATMGRFSFPIFRYVKLLKEPPQQVSAKVSEEINRQLKGRKEMSIRCVGVNGFLNAVVDTSSLGQETVRTIISDGTEYGKSIVGTHKTFLVEYSSPNIAKPFGIGHLRSTVIGNSLRRIYLKLGYAVTGINYPGDWGTQFGKMIVAYKKWGDDKTLEGNSVKKLLDLYVRFHKEVEVDPTLNDQAREAFKELEQGNPDAVRLWEKFKTISHAEFDRIYSMLGVEFDLVIGESFFNDKMDSVIGRLEKAGLTKVSQGALIVELDDPNLPPALLKKRDGATLYITRDLAGLIYRWQTYYFHESLYVVGSAQADHFRQCLKVINLLEQAENLSESERMTGKVKHIEFGWVKFSGKMMSTRQGNIVLLEDVIDRAVELITERIKEKSPQLANLDSVAKSIGVGAVLFSQLSVRRQTDVNFVWEEVLNFDGETGPYLQYTHARLSSLIRNYGKPVNATVDYALLEREEEKRVIELLADFPTAITDAARQYDPYFVTHYLLKLTGAFNKFYQRKDELGRIDRIISANAELSAARIALVGATRIVLQEGLYLLGLAAPEEM